MPTCPSPSTPRHRSLATTAVWPRGERRVTCRVAATLTRTRRWKGPVRACVRGKPVADGMGRRGGEGGRAVEGTGMGVGRYRTVRVRYGPVFACCVMQMSCPRAGDLVLRVLSTRSHEGLSVKQVRVGERHPQTAVRCGSQKASVTRQGQRWEATLITVVEEEERSLPQPFCLSCYHAHVHTVRTTWSRCASNGSGSGSGRGRRSLSLSTVHTYVV